MSQPPPYGQPPQGYGQPPTQGYGQPPNQGHGHVAGPQPGYAQPGAPHHAPVPYGQPHQVPVHQGFQHPQHAPRHTSRPFYTGCGALGMGVFGLGVLGSLGSLFSGAGDIMGLVTTLVFFMGFFAIFRAGKPKQIEAPKMSQDEIERNLLHMAASSNGRLTITQVTMNSPLNSNDAKENLDRMVDNGMANLDVDSNGMISYIFPDFVPRDARGVQGELDDFDRRLAHAQSAASSGAESHAEVDAEAEAPAYR